jgi:hypothetical protein
VGASVATGVACEAQVDSNRFNAAILTSNTKDFGNFITLSSRNNILKALIKGETLPTYLAGVIHH